MTIVVEQLSIGRPGPSVMVKDTFDVAGYPTRALSRALQDEAPAQHHAEVVQSLLNAGLRLTGKTNLHELAFHWIDTPTNPRFPDRIPGSSSNESAVAVAGRNGRHRAGYGSARLPACCCGVFGLNQRLPV